MESLLLLFLLATFGNAGIIRNGEQLERDESNISLPSDNTTSHASDVQTVFTEEQLEIGERCRNVSNGIVHSYNVQTIFSEEQLARRDVHLNVILRNEIHSVIFPVVFITWNYNSAMFIRVSGERRGQVLSDNIITQTNNAETVFNVEQLAASACLLNYFPDNSVTHRHNVAQVTAEQVSRRERRNTVFSGDFTTHANNVEPTIAEVEQEIREICMTVFSDNLVAGADNMQTVFTEEQIERYQRDITFNSTCY